MGLTIPPFANWVKCRVYAALGVGPSGWTVYDVVRLALGILFVLTALAKVRWLSSTPEKANLLPILLAGAAEVELALGAWLLSGVYAHLSRSLLIVFFFCFVCVAGYGTWSGATTCGCLGQVQVRPWMMLAFDCGGFALVWCLRPSGPMGVWDEYASARQFLCSFGPWVLRTAAVVVLAILTASLLVFGGLRRAAHVIRGDRVLVDPTVVELGACRYGEQRELTLHVQNVGRDPVQIVAGGCGSGCMATGGFPFLVDPGESRQIVLGLRLYAPHASFVRPLQLYSDSRAQPVIAVTFSGQMVSPQ